MSRLHEMIDERHITIKAASRGGGKWHVTLQSGQESLSLIWYRGSALAGPPTVLDIIQGLHPDIRYYHWSGGDYTRWVSICRTNMGDEVHVSRMEFTRWEHHYQNVEKLLSSKLFGEYLEMERLP